MHAHCSKKYDGARLRSAGSRCRASGGWGVGFPYKVNLVKNVVLFLYVGGMIARISLGIVEILYI